MLEMEVGKVLEKMDELEEEKVEVAAPATLFIDINL
jgi:hypothetical protein